MFASKCVHFIVLKTILKAFNSRNTREIPLSGFHNGQIYVQRRPDLNRADELGDRACRNMYDVRRFENVPLDEEL